MSKSLEARTKPEFYAELIARLRELNVADVHIKKQIAECIHEASELLAGRCPKCGSPSTRSVDYGRQQGSRNLPGAWVQYRCSTQPPIGQARPQGVCDFMVDFVEGEAAS